MTRNAVALLPGAREKVVYFAPRVSVRAHKLLECVPASIDLIARQILLPLWHFTVAVAEFVRFSQRVANCPAAVELIRLLGHFPDLFTGLHDFVHIDVPVHTTQAFHRLNFPYGTNGARVGELRCLPLLFLHGRELFCNALGHALFFCGLLR